MEGSVEGSAVEFHPRLEGSADTSGARIGLTICELWPSYFRAGDEPMSIDSWDALGQVSRAATGVEWLSWVEAS